MFTPSTVQSPSQPEAEYRLVYIWTISLVAAFVYLLRYLPETKGKTLEDIERELVD